MASGILQGDPNDAGGIALVGYPQVLINNKPLCQAGAPVGVHPGFGKKPHIGAALNPGGYGTVLVGNRPVAITGLPDTCGHGRNVSSGPSVRIGPG